MECNDEETLKTMLESPENSFWHDCGVTQAGFSIKFEDKLRIVSALCRHFTIFAAVAEIEQLLRGLKTLDFANLMYSYPSVMRTVFEKDKQPITADFIQDFFEVKFSPVGSNRRRVEEDIIMNWINYLHDIEGIYKLVGHFIYFKTLDSVSAPDSTEGDEEAILRPTIRDVFIFLTGCDSVPPLGFSGTLRQIEFDAGAVLPRVSTCSLVLFMPMTMPSDFRVFTEKMDIYILSSQGFGQL